jgi:indoleamine 2,3-dioxygenase
MWTKSKPTDYTTFRTFIFGIANQTMFPKGVLYEGVSEEPMFFRGESGANDSMVRNFGIASLRNLSNGAI